MEKTLWKDSRKDKNGWAYESDVAVSFLKAMSNLSWELHTRKIKPAIYEEFFNEVTDKVKDLLDNAPR